MILSFGAHRGKELSDPSIPDGYIEFLAKRGAYYAPGNHFEAKWKVPIDICIHARNEMERRKYKFDGDRWKKEE